MIKKYRGFEQIEERIVAVVVEKAIMIKSRLVIFTADELIEKLNIPDDEQKYYRLKRDIDLIDYCLPRVNDEEDKTARWLFIFEQIQYRNGKYHFSINGDITEDLFLDKHIFQYLEDEPNVETYAAMEEAERMLQDPNTLKFSSIDDLFKHLDEEVSLTNYIELKKRNIYRRIFDSLISSFGLC